MSDRTAMRERLMALRGVSRYDEAVSDGRAASIPSSASAAVPRRRQIGTAIACVAVGVALPVFAHDASGLLAALVFFMYGATRLVALRTEPLALPVRRSAGVVTFDEAGVRFVAQGHERPTWSVAASAIEQGFAVPARLARDVVLQARDGDAYVFRVLDEEAADRALDAAGVAPEQRRLRIRVAPPSFHWAVGCLAMVAAIAATPVWIFSLVAILGFVGHEPNRSFGAFVAFAVSTLVGALVVLSALPPTLEIGLDGVLVRDALRRRFVPFSTITGVSRSGDFVVLQREVWAPLRFRAFTRSYLAGDATATLADALTRAMLAGTAKRSAAQLAERLDRGSETFAAWRDRVAALGVGGDYRSARPAQEVLIEVVDDAQAPAHRRVGAALAIAKMGDAEALGRVRVAAETSADEALRAALHAASEDELTEELEAPLRRRALQ